jgi:hypothetical protein
VPQVAGAVIAYTSADPMLRAPNGHASLVVVSVRKNAGMMAQMMAVDAIRSATRGVVPTRGCRSVGISVSAGMG